MNTGLGEKDLGNCGLLGIEVSITIKEEKQLD